MASCCVQQYSHLRKHLGKQKADAAVEDESIGACQGFKWLPVSVYFQKCNKLNGIFSNVLDGKEKKQNTRTLTTPRKTFCVAAMSSSLCSARLGWMLSFWAASSTCCPDTVTDSNRDDISMCRTASSVSLICLEVIYHKRLSLLT